MEEKTSKNDARHSSVPQSAIRNPHSNNPHSNTFLKCIVPNFDYRVLRFSHEDESLGEIKRSTELAALPQGPLDSVLAAGEIVTPTTHSPVFRVTSLICKLFGIEPIPEITVVPWGRWFLEYVPGEDPSKFRLVISSVLASQIWERHTLFDLGRKMGRVLLVQGDRIEPLLTDPTAAMESDENILLVRRRWRYQELGADRVGLLFCQDLRTAIQFISWESASTDRERLDPEFLSVSNDCLELETAVAGSERDFGAFRVLALQRFVASGEYQACLESDGYTDSYRTNSFAESRTPLESSQGESGDPEEEPARLQTHTAQNDLQEPEEERILDTESEGFGALRNEFLVHGALWITSMKDDPSERERESLVDLVGDGAVTEVERTYVAEGEGLFRRVCQNVADRLVSLDHDSRLTIIKDLFYVVMADGMPGSRENDLLLDLAKMIGLAPDDLTVLAAEYVDPEFADYAFEVGQEVAVQLDGQWVTGRIENIDPSGDLRVHFPAVGDVLLLNTTADLIRPT